MDFQGSYFRNCVVTATNSVKKEGTCSGILIDTQFGIILTHASLLSPLVSRNSQFMKDIQIDSYSTNREVKELNLEIILQLKPFKNGEKSERFQPNLLNNNLQQETDSTDKYKASLLCVFQCPSLKNSLSKLVPSGNWEFVEDLSDPAPKKLDKSQLDQAGSSVYYDLLPFFVILRLHDWFGYKSYLPYKLSTENEIGDNVEINATPFGGLNPEVFLNSRSQGIISNISGKNKVLIMVDARCIPGSEGGALYYTQGKIKLLTGMIIATLCWKNNEWIGLSLACAISEILDNLFQLPVPLSGLESSSFKQIALQWTQKLCVKNISKAVKFVKVGSNWGSGVVISQEPGGRQLMLTCSHVVRESEHRPVKIRKGETKEDKIAEVIFKTPVGKHFDIAFLSYFDNASLHEDNNSINITSTFEGETVLVIGHAIFGDNHDLEPTVTKGVVSKVIKLNNTPVMLQTTCAVHAGASGGAVVNMKGQLVGIVVCNAKDTSSGASYPHVNMCVPIATVAEVLEKYRKTLDENILQNLHIKNPKVNRLWTLGTSNTDSQIQSKL